uniref:Salivary protein 15 Ipac-1 n=1 Tax=Ixodes pacificus TaxID=29930 RepID=SP151_IXOPA|nr:RecName: Full=Salivary protein 15 Ipac-1; Short=Salp15 Ipac-1; Flags: Precursor [Ixodes pacificus]ACV32166.1 Salp15 [Ixodes pacificus]
MKVVCIILLFGIAAANVSATNKAGSSKNAKDTEGKKEILRFPRFIPNPKELATKLLDICKEHEKDSPSSYTAINDKHLDFKNCTFLCKHGPHKNVTLALPEETPCGPSGQTCADKSKCVGHIPGC